LNILAYTIYRAVLDATINYNAHAKFASREVAKLETDEKKDIAPAAKDEPVEDAAPADTAATETNQSEPAATAA
jgi:hypothetical protein